MAVPSQLAVVLRDLREAEAEILQLKEQLASSEASLRDALKRSPPADTPSVVVLDAAEGHKRRLAAIRGSRLFVFVVAFTYDLDDVTQALMSV